MTPTGAPADPGGSFDRSPSAPADATADPTADPAQALAQADALIAARQWPQALQACTALQPWHPDPACIAHRLALCHQALGDTPAAIAPAQHAWQTQPAQWPSGLLLARLQHHSGQRLPALATLQALRRLLPQEPAITLEAARRSLHTLGNPRASARLVEPLLSDPLHGPQAQRMQLLAQLYDRPATLSAAQLAQQIRQHARQHLQAATPALHTGDARTARANGSFDASANTYASATAASTHGTNTSANTPLRIGLLGNQLHASPVYYLTIGALQALHGAVQWIVFARGSRRDWATRAFESIATQWHDVSGLAAPALAATLASQRLHALLDLGGWMDPTALQALAARPAPRQYKWVGGQSLTTGLDCFDGFISDAHHTPPGSQPHYSEPLILLPGGYAGYTPPPYVPAPQQPPADGLLHLGIVSNPAKASLGFLQFVRDHWPRWQAASPLPLRLHLIDQRHAIAPLQQHLRQHLPGIDLQFETPASHADYLQALGRLHAVIDTFPYSGGLTTLEAHHLGVPVYTHGQGLLFCERHSHAHQQLLGLPQPSLLDADFHPAHALHTDRDRLRLNAKSRGNHQPLAQALWQILNSNSL